MWAAYLVLVLGCVMRGLVSRPGASACRRRATVPICRAAFGALEKLRCVRSLSGNGEAIPMSASTGVRADAATLDAGDRARRAC